MNNLETAVFGGGCFWCTEALFNELKGIFSVVSGYAGGNKPNPTYEEVCGGATGYAEVIKIEFDPNIIKFTDLLTVFFATHDPTTLNRQGNDVGTQYRSVIFYTSDEQKLSTENFIRELNTDGAKVVTQVQSLDKFWPAEKYHSKYYERNADQPYCQVIISPKMGKLKEKFYALLKEENK